MDAFEKVIEQIIRQEGYWTRTSFKVELTKPEKVAIGRPSSPRWELDVVGYNAARNEIRIIECKSYLDSPGVHYQHFNPANKGAKRYKLFVEPRTREVVLRRLALQLTHQGLCAPNPKVKLALAAGKVSKGETEIKALFKRRGFIWYGPDWVRKKLEELSTTGYENEVASVVSKLLLRKQKT